MMLGFVFWVMGIYCCACVRVGVYLNPFTYVGNVVSVCQCVCFGSVYSSSLWWLSNGFNLLLLFPIPLVSLFRVNTNDISTMMYGYASQQSTITPPYSQTRCFKLRFSPLANQVLKTDICVSSRVSAHSSSQQCAVINFLPIDHAINAPLEPDFHGSSVLAHTVTFLSAGEISSLND